MSKQLSARLLGFKRKHNHALWYKVLKFFYRAARFPFDFIKKRSYREHARSFGALHPDKTIFIIRRMPPAGFLSNFHHVLQNLEIAEKRGLTPVVDMENYPNFDSEEVPINGSKNAWEYFFEQPSGISLAEAYKCKTVILSDMNYPNIVDIMSLDYLNDPAQIKKTRELMSKYIKVKPVVSEFVEEGWNKIKKDSDILGVVMRGTDYAKLKLFAHPIQPSPEFMIEKTKEIMQQNDIKYCFLKTEERAVLEKFRREFGDNLLFTDTFYYDEMDPNLIICEHKHSRDNPRYWSNMEYFRDIVILSKCDYLLCGINNGSVTAIEMNGGAYKEKYVIYLGKYGIEE